VDDRAIVAALVSGDPRGLEGAYRTYADRLYTYCRGVLRDPDAAADAVHDTFLLAGQRIGQLRDPDRLRSWLYAISRNECLRILRRRRRDVPLEEAGQVSAPPVEPEAGMHAADVRELVWAAAEGLNPGDREVFELAVRHELPAPEVGAALGVSVAHAHARLSRARAQLERALGALLVARTGRRDCPELEQMLQGWDGRLTALVRKRVSRHVESCETCSERQRRQLSPAALFSAYAGLPMLVAPAEIWPRLELTSADAGYLEALEARAGRWDPGTGFPAPLPVRRRRTAVAAVAAVAVAAVFAFAGGFLVSPPVPASGPDPLPTTPPVTATAKPGPTATPSPTPTPTPTAPPAPTAVPTTAPPTFVLLAVIANDRRSECIRGTYVLRVDAQATLPLDSAVLVVQVPGATVERYDMTVVGPLASHREVVPAARFEWWVEVAAGDQLARTAPVPVETDCR
jgi:RNA polymerase sigma factor (sigma-70 family)